MVREPREKKETLKKREAKGVTNQGAARTTPDRNGSHGGKRNASEQPVVTYPAPIRYKLPPPRRSDYEAPRGPVMTYHHSRRGPDGEVQFYETSEQ